MQLLWFYLMSLSITIITARGQSDFGDEMPLGLKIAKQPHFSKSRESVKLQLTLIKGDTSANADSELHNKLDLNMYSLDVLAGLAHWVEGTNHTDPRDIQSLRSYTVIKTTSLTRDNLSRVSSISVELPYSPRHMALHSKYARDKSLNLFSNGYQMVVLVSLISKRDSSVQGRLVLSTGLFDLPDKSSGMLKPIVLANRMWTRWNRRIDSDSHQAQHILRELPRQARHFWPIFETKFTLSPDYIYYQRSMSKMSSDPFLPQLDPYMSGFDLERLQRMQGASQQSAAGEDLFSSGNEDTDVEEPVVPTLPEDMPAEPEIEESSEDFFSVVQDDSAGSSESTVEPIIFKNVDSFTPNPFYILKWALDTVNIDLNKLISTELTEKLRQLSLLHCSTTSSLPMSMRMYGRLLSTPCYSDKVKVATMILKGQTASEVTDIWQSHSDQDWNTEIGFMPSNMAHSVNFASQIFWTTLNESN